MYQEQYGEYLLLLGIVFLAVFLLQNNIFKKISQQQNASILNTSALFFFLENSLNFKFCVTCHFSTLPVDIDK